MTSKSVPGKIWTAPLGFSTIRILFFCYFVVDCFEISSSKIDCVFHISSFVNLWFSQVVILFWAWLGCDANSTCIQVTFRLYVNIVALLRHYIMIFFLFIITANPTREEIEECSRKFESQSM